MRVEAGGANSRLYRATGDSADLAVKTSGRPSSPISRPFTGRRQGDRRSSCPPPSPPPQAVPRAKRSSRGTSLALAPGTT